jgi:hypothetical protein
VVAVGEGVFVDVAVGKAAAAWVAVSWLSSGSGWLQATSTTKSNKRISVF